MILFKANFSLIIIGASGSGSALWEASWIRIQMAIITEWMDSKRILSNTTKYPKKFPILARLSGLTQKRDNVTRFSRCRRSQKLRGIGHCNQISSRKQISDTISIWGTDKVCKAKRGGKSRDIGPLTLTSRVNILTGAGTIITWKAAWNFSQCRSTSDCYLTWVSMSWRSKE